MSEEMLVRHCAPTLAGMKTGSMLSCEYKSRDELCRDLRRWNRMLSHKGLRVIPLRYNGHCALIYIYRPLKLKRDLVDETARSILRGCGYSEKAPERCIVHLIKRMAAYEDFPHEVGLFLGYPPEDVSGFIKNKAKDSKLVGAWKVYGDVAEAERTFAKYKKCTDAYCACLARGKSVEHLAVFG